MCAGGPPVPVVLAQAVQAKTHNRRQKNIKLNTKKKFSGEIIHV
jgi:hypothetical protein